jgi:hypothetical protein
VHKAVRVGACRARIRPRRGSGRTCRLASNVLGGLTSSVGSDEDAPGSVGEVDVDTLEDGRALASDGNLRVGELELLDLEGERRVHDHGLVVGHGAMRWI